MPRFLFIAAAAVCAAGAQPALAVGQSSAPVPSSSWTGSWNASEPIGRGLHGGFHGRDRRDGRYSGATPTVSGFGGSGGWAVYGFRSFGPDKLNDWWHDNPQRSMPRWTSNNGNCQRIWWSGGGWRC